MITLSQLQTKEVVLLESGKRLGMIQDFDIQDDTGKIRAIIVASKQGGSLFQRMEEKTVLWEQIVTIGDDIILVNEKAMKQEDIHKGKA